MDVFHKHYQLAFEKFRNKQQLLGCILTSWHVFDKYYQLSDESPVYAAALILHPSRRKAHILKNWPRSWHRTAFNSVKALWENNYKELPSEDPTSLELQQLPDEYELFARELDIVGANGNIDEYETFTSQVPTSIDCIPLIWWLRDEQKSHYPNLSRMAIDILSIPAMSADPEGVFSGARCTISWDRMQLGSSVIERGECLKSWIRSGITRGMPSEMIDEYLEKQN